jgi:3-deoxy-manno-octulosonate cytidylyltransferase (CMP-KDO synthetase)
LTIYDWVAQIVNRQSAIVNHSLSVLAVIPARYASSRFPGKMLADRTGKPLIQHVWERAKQAKTVDQVIVATEDQRIFDAVVAFGGEAIMTRPDHLNGTSRIAEAVERLEMGRDEETERRRDEVRASTTRSVSSSLRLSVSRPFEIVVNVQGDEPDLAPALIDLAIDTLERHRDCPVATIASPFAPGEDPANPNIVKVVIDRFGRAMYFSRALIPFNRDGVALDRACGPFKHVGLYVYRREFLPMYVNLPATPLEQAEKLEQLRVLEHGHKIAVALAEAHHHGIDTPEQYDAFVKRAS